MIKQSLFSIAVFSSLLFCTPKAQDGKEAHTVLKELFSFPTEVKEVSGIQFNPVANVIYSHEDHGNKNEIYTFSLDGKWLSTTKVTDINNEDWEDITKDKYGDIYIGDFGNNDNDRKDLTIYKLGKIEGKEVKSQQKTEFYYPEQTEFPPKKSKLLYDCEAFFEKDGFFYLFTKNRSKNFDGKSLIYKIPNKEGRFKAELIGEFLPEGKFNDAAITAADISPDGKTVALLSHKKVFLLKNFDQKGFSFTTIDLQSNTQKEGLSFKDNTTIYIADEAEKGRNALLYSIQIP